MFDILYFLEYYQWYNTFRSVLIFQYDITSHICINIFKLSITELERSK